MQLSEVDLINPDTFRTGQHHAMFEVLRAEDPIHWTEEPDGGGFWSVTRHADLIAVNRDTQVFSSAEQGISIPDIPPEGAMVREMMLYMDPPRHTRYRRLVNRVFTPRSLVFVSLRLLNYWRLDENGVRGRYSLIRMSQPVSDSNVWKIKSGDIIYESQSSTNQARFIRSQQRTRRLRYGFRG